MRIVYTCLLFLSLFASKLESQSIDRFVPDFTLDDKVLANPLTGGLEAPQFQEIDLNFDGEKDLLVFDRKGSVIRTFIYDPEADYNFVYAPEYEGIFPHIQCWVHVKDYNKDGIDDLFTCGVTDPVTGVEVWKGVNIDGKLAFEVIDHKNGPYNIIYYESGSDYKQLYVGNNGIPAFSDIDGDEDVDILAFQPSGGYLYYFQNQSQERGFGNDSLIFTREDDCWGKFYEGGLVPDIILSENVDVCALPMGAGSFNNRHEGITITALDKNEDGLMDLLIGEVSSNNVIYVENGGDSETAFATYKETDFPNLDVPANMQIFLGTFLVDADRDGRKDLIVSPNSQFGKNTENAWLYENIEMNGEANYQLVQEDWLVEESLDFGTDSYPAFCDYNADGLVDIVVSSYGLIGGPDGIETRLYLFENVGDAANPAYKLVDDDYLDFLAFSSFDKSYVPAFGDLDGDDDMDILMGSLSGQFIYLENTAGPGNPYEFANPVFDYLELNAQNNTIKVSIGDLNDDGLGDIIVGGRNSYSLDDGIGSLKYFINEGSIGNASFSNENAFLGLGGVNMKEAGNSKVSANPKYYVNGDEKLLFISNEVGRVAVFQDTDGDGPFELLIEDLFEARYGRRITIDVADIDADGYLEMVMGNERGGLNMFHTVIQASGAISSTEEEEIAVDGLILHPNPANDILYLKSDYSVIDKVQVFNALGQLMLSETLNDNALDVSSLRSGIYYLKIDDIVYKFIKAN